MKLNKNSNSAFAKYSVVVAGICMVFVCLGFCSSNKSLYLSAITEALSIPRSLFSINDSVRYISTAVVNLFFGTLIAKFGAKKLVAAGFLSLIASTLVYANATEVTTFYIGGAFLGIGLSWTTTTMVSYLVNRWFKENRGTISGIVLCANGLGGALAAQIVTPIIFEQGNVFGYRNAYNMVAILLAVVGVLVVCFIREPDGPAPEGAGKKKSRGRSWTGITLNEALRKPYFYGAAVCVFLTGMSLQGINGIAGSHLKDVGIDTGFVATVMSIHSIVLCGSKLFAGFSYDKLGLRYSLMICEMFGVLSFIALALAGSSGFGIGCAVAWGALASMALPLETVMVPLIAADLFGEKEYPKLVGLFVSINTAGYALGTPLANVIFDIFKTYVPVLYIFAGVMLCMIVGFVFITGASEKTRKQVALLEQAATGEEQ